MTNDRPTAVSPAPLRITSIDALRGFVMFLMIFVNDLAGAPEKIVPNWMVHFSDRHRGGSGMTFVDLVFPGFLFIVGMSIPFALGPRLLRGEPVWKILWHVLTRTISLLAIGILMVHETPDSARLGWPGQRWCLLMYLSAIFAFCAIAPINSGAEAKTAKWHPWKIVSLSLRVIGMISMFWLALAFRDDHGRAILTLSPFQLAVDWYGILGLIAWTYLVASLVYLIFRNQRTAVLGCMVLLFCLFAADRKGLFENFWLANYVGIGEMLGSLAAISVGGLLLGLMLKSVDLTTLKARATFTFWFVAACAAAALLLQPLYGISKNNATPSWCLWSCVVTATLWFLFYLICDVRPVKWISRPLALAGQNVLLAYLISEMSGSLFDALHIGDWYDRLSEPHLAAAITRSAACGVVILLVASGLNRLGFRLRL
jgi:heparan-alpha-glucosaminide N-acetyltransferase